MMPVVNNLTRMLDAKNIPHTAYELPAEKLGALATARFLNIPIEQVYKTIVALRSSPGSKPILAVIPGNSKLDVKALAAALNEKKVQVPSQRDAEQLTGLQAGGISPLALINRGFTIVLDQSSQAHEHIHVSGGQRGLNIRLAVKDLLRLTNARLAKVSFPTMDDEEE
jgi:Cys-tRNA(Pro)/Cys-tRNA(Cys) deacylase